MNIEAVLSTIQKVKNRVSLQKMAKKEMTKLKLWQTNFFDVRQLVFCDFSPRLESYQMHVDGEEKD